MYFKEKKCHLKNRVFWEWMTRTELKLASTLSIRVWFYIKTLPFAGPSWYSLNRPNFTDHFLLKTSDATYLLSMFCSTGATSTGVSRGKKKNHSLNPIISHSNTFPPPAPGMLVCVNMPAPTSNRARERGKIKAQAIKKWDCADDPNHTTRAGSTGNELWLLSLSLLCKCLFHSPTDCTGPICHSCQVILSSTGF